jgi:O-antigen/teichoic acid export membrane protein
VRESAHKFSQKVLGEGGLRVVSTLFVLFLARSLGAADFGRYSTALAYAALCIVFVDLGTNFILTREIARHPENRVQMARSSHLLKIAAAVISWLILWLVTVLFKFGAEQRFVTLCLGIVVIGQTLTEYFCALLSGIEEMGWEAALKVISRTLSLSFGFLSLALRQPLHAIVSNMAFGTIISYAVSAWILNSRFQTFGIGIDLPFLKSLLWSSFPLFGSVIFWILYDSQDILLLNYFHFAQKEIGCFSAAMKIMDVARVYPVLMMGAFFPTLSKLHLSDSEGFHRKKRRLLLFMAGSLTLLAAVIYGAAPWIILLLYKSDFLSASMILKYLAPTLIIMGLNHTQMQFLIALNRERKLFSGALMVCIVNLLLAWIFLPRFGVSGACYALFGSEITYFLFLRLAMRSEV